MKINEAVPDPAGADTDLEWVELYNPTGATIDISGWAIAAGAFELLTEHVFTSAGWRRISSTGRVLDGVDIVLE